VRVGAPKEALTGFEVELSDDALQREPFPRCADAGMDEQTLRLGDAEQMVQQP